MERTLSALYDHRADAMSAVDDLIAAGIPRDHIAVISGAEPGESDDSGTFYGTEHEAPGFWETLASIFSTEEERRAYDEGISRGGATVVAVVDDNELDRAISILESHNAVDLKEREQSSTPAASEGLHRSGRVRVHTPGLGPTSETEAREKSVVSKEARVTEELRLRKEASQRFEGVEDASKHTESDMDDNGSETEKGRS